MLSMSVMSASQAGYYLGLAREDYYLEGGEPPGRWYGQGAELLGLSGQVEADQLYNLFAGRSPDGSRSLIQRQRQEGRAEHRPGWDLTFSVPKSVSVLWSQSSEPIQKVIQNLHHHAVESALSYLEDTATSTRRGKGGHILERVGLLVSTFEHSTSRALDPQLHTHALVMNLSVRSDGTTGTLSSLDLFLSKMAAGALYRAELAKGLQEKLELELRKEHSWFEVEGISPSLIDVFSKRRAAIEQQLRATGLSGAKASAIAAIQTRSAKEGVSRQDLFEDWRGEGQRHGWNPGAFESLLGRGARPGYPERILAHICGSSIERLTGQEAHFTERDFVRFLAEESQTLGVGATEVRIAVSEYLANSHEIVFLGEHRGECRYTTSAMFRLERELISVAERLASNTRHHLHTETVVGHLSRNGELSEEQMRAVWNLTTQTGAIAIVSGMAGTGKTRMLGVAREAWQSEGFEVIGTSLSARAAKELESGAGISSTTIAQLLIDLERKALTFTPKTILVLDEAGMVATPEMERLLKACEHGGSKIALIGDERQIQPIGPGAPFDELGRRHGKSELTDIRRQSEHWARQAVRDLAEGRSSVALEAFAERGLLTIAENKHDAMDRLIERWRDDGLNPEDTLILAGTKSEVRDLNRCAQEARRDAGELGLLSTVVGEVRIYENDRVMFIKNKRTLGIQNGARGTVQSVSKDGDRVTVRLDSGERVSFDTLEFKDFDLGYAATTHKAQGATTQRAYILGGGPMQGRELAYVQASRAKVKTQIFAMTSETGNDVAELARNMGRSRRKTMAVRLTSSLDEGISF